MKALATIVAALTLCASASAQAPPLPDHPVTGKPVQPAWSYWSTAVSRNGLWRLLCYSDAVADKETCWVVGFTHAGAYAIMQGWYVLRRG